MGPLTMTSTESGLVVVATPRRSNSGWLTASTAATSKGMCLGSHPAMTALTAIFPTVATPSSGGSVAMGKSSGRSYPASGFDAFGWAARASPSPTPGRGTGVERLKPSPAASMVSVSAREKSTAVPDEEARMVSTYTPSLALPRRLQTVRLARLRRRHEEQPRREQKRKDDAHDGSFERFLWAFVEARFGIVPNALNGASREDEPLRPDAGSGPGYAKTPTARGDPGLLANGLRTFRKQGRSPEEGPGVEGYSAIFAETGFRTCGKGTQNWDCLPGPPETIILMDSRWVKRGIRVLAS